MFMEGHFGEYFNEDTMLIIALESFVEAGAIPGGQHSLHLIRHKHTVRKHKTEGLTLDGFYQ